MAAEPVLVCCLHCGRRNRVAAASRGAPVCAVCKSDLPWMVEADEAGFEFAVLASDLPVLVDFWAPWCAPCRIVSPLVERLGEELRGRLKVVKVNTDQNPDLSNRFSIRGIPTLMLFDGGRQVARQTGALDAVALERWVDGYLATRPAPAAR